MVRDRDPFGLALSRLREDLRDGRLKSGEPLITTELAASLRISATPVREALSRLAGEGLLDDRRGRGFYALRYGAAEVEDLYRLHGAYVALALDIRGGLPRGDLASVAFNAPTQEPRLLRERWERFWTALVHTPDGEALVRAHQRVTDQVAVLRLVEPMVLADVVGELEQISSLSVSGSPKTFRVAIVEYHRRRQTAARSIASALRAPQGIEQI